MITIEMLNEVQQIITHQNCPDGLASAIILLDAFSGRLTPKDVVFAQYMTEAYDTIEACPGMLFCDISPPLSRAQEFVDAGALVLDHHEPEKVAPYGERGVHSKEPGVSGAVLALHNVWEPLKGIHTKKYFRGMREIAELAGIRDTWQKSHERWRESCAQAASLMFWPQHLWLAEAAEQRDRFDRFDIGETLLDKRSEQVLRAFAGHSPITSRKGARIAIVSGTDLTSDVAEEIRVAIPADTRPDIVIGFKYDCENRVPKLILSCRSVTDRLVQPFCAYYGGGGHARAAGVSIPVESNSIQPYGEIELLWNRWEETTTR